MAPCKAANDFQEESLVGVVLLNERRQRIRDLSGFRKHYRLPVTGGNAAEAFLAEISGDEVAQDVEAAFQKLKGAFALKRREIQVARPGDGTATITTPFFQYSIEIQLDTAEPSYVVWRRTIETIRSAAPLLSAEFDAVFGEMFSTLTLPLPQAADLEQLVDRLEDLEDDRVTLDYDTALTYCRLKIDPLPVDVVIRDDALSIVHHRPAPPRLLLETYFALNQALFHAGDLKQISFGPDG